MNDFLICPDCQHANVQGSDVCEQCGQVLAAASEPRPVGLLERQIVVDEIRTLKPRNAVIVESTTTVAEALNKLVANGIGCLLVMENDEIVGIFTERDALLKLNAEIAQFTDRPVSEFMTPGPVTLKSSDRIAFALHRMDLGGYRHVPILDKDLPPKVISIRDILRYMTELLVKQ